MDVEPLPMLKLLAGYAETPGHEFPLQLASGARVHRSVRQGQAAHPRHRTSRRTPSPVGSVFFQALPRNVVVLPVSFEGQIKAVISLASLGEFSATHLAFLEQLTASIGILLNSIEATMQTEGLLKQSQQLTNELQTQQKELQQTNEQLALKAQQLAEQNAEVERKNQEIEQARRALEEKAEELALTSKYKSEFLANMSHELRTPLNSILILGQQLTDNPEKNLTPKQVEFARTIHGAGTDLLNLITDILDLSKIESGTVTVEAEEIFFTNLLEMVVRTFKHDAENRGLSFEVQVDSALGRSIVTDSKRLQQVLKNLLSNAFKFTSQGGVRLNVTEVVGGWTPHHPVLSQAGRVVAFEVSDTGIGIPPEKQRIIFEAFQQADASTSRKYGGTGLGLAISRELSTLLGGEIQLRSTPGVGIDVHAVSAAPLRGAVGRRRAASEERRAARHGAGAARGAAAGVPRRRSVRRDDRRRPRRSAIRTMRSLLIVEDDPHYARILVDLAHDKGFKVLVAMRGSEALSLARQFRPMAVSLDVFLPDMLGWTVLSQLKQDPETRHIPVQIVTLEEDRQHGLARGAFSFITKPTTTEGLEAAIAKIKTYAAPRRKRLLVVEDNAAEQLSITELLGHDDLEVVVADTGEAALAAMREQPCDCVVLDLRLPDMSGFEVLEHISEDEQLADVPVVVFTGRELSAEEDAQLHTLARSVVVKGVESPERLLDETSLFLHRVFSDLPAEKQRMLERLHRSDEDLRRQGGARRGRRHPQHLRVEQRARTPRHEGAHGEHRQRGDQLLEVDARAVDRADGYHDAGDGRLSDDAEDQGESGVPAAADRRADGESDEGRPREVLRGGRVGLSRETRQHRAVAVSAPDVAASIGRARDSHERARARIRSTSCWSTTSRRSCSPTSRFSASSGRT